MSRNLDALTSRLLGRGETAFTRLGELADETGRVTPDDVDCLAEETGLPAQQIRSVAEFYDELHPQEGPPVRVKVCGGEACRAAGADALASELGGRLEGGVGSVTCLGQCSHGPNLAVDGRAVAADGPDTVEAVSRFVNEGGPLDLPEPENPIRFPGADEPRVLLARLREAPSGRALGWPEEGYAALKKARAMGAEALRAEIGRSGLRGRGGAGFPAGRKYETVARAPSPDGRRFVVANLDEGDAGAYIDKELAERDPHALIEGLMIAAFACGADEAFIYVRHEYPHAMSILASAVDDARAHGYAEPRIRLVRGRGAYVCGEETSLLRSIEGVAAQVGLRPPYPAESGLWGRPTAVNNVETLANLPWIVIRGAEAYAELGTAKSSGTKLVSLNNRVARPGLYEIEMGVPLRDFLFGEAGGMADGQTFQAVQIGGPLGAILPESALDAPLSFEGLEAVGGTLGHAGMVVFSEDDDLFDVVRGLMAFAARESCGKCFPCRIGTTRGVELLDVIAERGMTPSRRALLDDLLETLSVGSLCGLGGMVPVPVRSLLDHFPELWPEGREGRDG